MMGNSRILWIIIGAATLLAGDPLWGPQSLRADQVWSSGIHYEEATIESIDDKTVTFVFQGRHITKPNDATTRIELEGFDPFNEAEKLLADKNFADAKLAYQAAADKAKTDLQRRVVRMRSAVARNPQPSATSKPATRPDDKRCYFCGNNGKMRCPDCDGKGTLHGNVCPTCNGEKTVPCTHCEYGKKLRDSLPPPTVAAKPPDKHADTPPDDPHDVVIVGTRREPSTKPDDTPDTVVQNPTHTKVPQTTKPPEHEAPEEPVSADPLLSPDAMVRAITSFPSRPEKSPDWDAKTVPQRQEAQQQYQKDIAEWNKTHDFRKVHVHWRVIVQAVQPGKNKQDFLVLADTKGGTVVGVTFLPKDQDLVKSFSKAQAIRVTGTVKEYGGGPKDTKEDWFNPDNDKPYDILLVDPTVETGTDAPKDPTPKPAK